MKYKSVVITSVAIAATAALVTLGTSLATSVPAFSHGANVEQGQVGGTMTNNSHMGGQMVGQMGSQMGGQMGGQMGSQMGSQMGMGGMGHMRYHMNGNPAMDLDLDVDDVRNIIEGRLAMHGNDRLKVGEVTVVDDDTITAEIVTVDNSLVTKLEFDRKTGAHHPIK